MNRNPELRSAKDSKRAKVVTAALGTSAAVLGLAMFFLFGDKVVEYARESFRESPAQQVASQGTGQTATTRQKPSSATPPAPTAPSSSVAAEGCGPDIAPLECRTRQEIIERLQTWRTELKSALAGLASAPWAVPALQEIKNLEKKGVDAFGDGKYSVALEQLKAAEAAVRALLQTAERRFADDLKAAVAAFEASDPDRARKRIEDALLIKPDHAEARVWQIRISVLPAFLEALAEADRARAENNPKSEKAFLEKVVGLDSSRPELRERLRKVSRGIAERTFADHIVKGGRAVADRDPEVARKALAAARRLYAKRPEVATLARDLGVLERELALERYLSRARTAVAADDWESARNAFDQAGKVDGEDTAAVSGARLAQRILDAEIAIAPYLARPGRLSTDAVAAEARAALDGIADLLAKSPNLARNANALEINLRQAVIEIPIKIVSDNQTEIAVQGVGRVGKTRERMIALKPGTYVFEGRRPGYRSKLLTVTIVAGVDPEVIILICDDRI